ncbi:hypothetical protein Q7P36_007690 [Cladosporium allicinum]
MSIPYIPGDPVLRWSLALDHFQACIQAVIEEGINSNSLVPAAEDEEAPLYEPPPRDDASSKNPEPNLVGKDEVEKWRKKVERGDEKAEEQHSVHRRFQKDQPTQNTTTQVASAKLPTGDDATLNPFHIAPLAKIQRDQENLKAEFGQRFNGIEDAFARLPQFPGAEMSAQGAFSLGVSVERLRECLLQMSGC